MIYFDHHSATRPCDSAIERMKPYLDELWGSASSPHKMGQELIAALDTRYQMIYDFVSLDPKDLFVFTSNGAEAVNQVLWSVFQEVARKEGKCHFIASALEDAPTMQMLKRLEELGCSVKIAPVNERGEIDLEQLQQLITPRTAMLSLTLAHGLTGVIQPIEEISRICREKKVLLHVDGTYALGKMYLSFNDLGADYLTFSGDRLHALKSSGGLFAKNTAPLVPYILGGSEQAGYRGGSFDVPSFMALSAAVQQAALYLDNMSLETARLRDSFEAQIEKRIPGAKPLFTSSLRLPNTSAISFSKAHQEALLYLLNRKGLYASIGGPYSQHLSRILSAAKISERDAECALSFSFSRMTTAAEIDRAIPILCEAVEHLQRISERISL